MDAEFARLVDRWRDGELSVAERAALARRLRADAALAADFHAAVRFEGRLAGLLPREGDALWRRIDDALAVGADAGVAERVLAHLARRRMRRGRPWLIAAAVLILIGGLGGGWLAWTRMPAAVTVAVTDERGERPGRQAVPAGTRLVYGNDEHARLTFTDGSRVEVGAGSAVRLAGIDRGGARMELTDGNLQAVIAKQPAGTHFVIRTGEAVLTVIGTRFTAIRLPWGTRLEVTEGRVLTQQVADGSTIEVPAGMVAEVRTDAVRPLMLQPLLPALPPGAVRREPAADAIVVGGRYARENRGRFPAHILTSPDAPPDERREFYLRFDLAGIRRPVGEARLHLHVIQVTVPDIRLEVARVPMDAWGEYAITWDTRPAAGPVVAEWRPGPDDPGIDLTAAINGAGDALSLRIRTVAGTPPHAVIGFNTREAPAHMRPQLVLRQAP